MTRRLKSKDREFLRVGEVARLLGVNKWTVYRNARLRRVPAIRFGRLWLFPREAIEQWKRGAGLFEVAEGVADPDQARWLSLSTSALDSWADEADDDLV